MKVIIVTSHPADSGFERRVRARFKRNPFEFRWVEQFSVVDAGEQVITFGCGRIAIRATVPN